MSAIVGFLGLDGRPCAESDLQRMVDAVAHRGPDGQQTWREDRVGLGHCMLHTTPESLTERLPLHRGSLAITADARLDNREELLRALRPDLRQVDGISDSELILAAYRRWGPNCPQRLLGDFAFVIWDAEKHEIFCARDHFGVRPFYYFHESGKRFVFGSEIKAIFALRDVPRRLNEAKMADYLFASFEDKQRTFYLDIHRLPPASTMRVTDGGVQIEQYWSLDPEREVRLKSDEEYAQAYREHFVEAVNCRLRSAFPVGSMLSGGLDSSSIACVANELLGSRNASDLHTYSIVFDRVTRSDERQYIDQVLAARRFVPHMIDGDAVTPLDDLERVLWHQDEPFNAPNFSLSRSGWRAASASGVRVLLDGVFGDNVVSHGREHMQSLAARWHLVPLARELKAYIRKADPDAPVLETVTRYIVEHGVKPYVPESGMRAWRALHGRAQEPAAVQSGLFEAGYRVRNDLERRLADADRRDRRPKSARHAHVASLCGGLVESALEIYGRGCGEFALESRFPYLDKRLVEFCLAIPGEQKVSQGYTRAIARRALKDYLPEAIRLRHDKGNLRWSFSAGVRSKRDLVLRTLESSQPFLDQYLDAARMRGLRDQYLDETIGDPDLLDLFLVVVLGAWHLRGSKDLGAWTSDASHLRGKPGVTRPAVQSMVC